MEANAKALIEQGDRLFSKRRDLLSLWQELADNFYPERADFTLTRSLGDEFAEHLTTSMPVLTRRDLANSFSAMLRPTETDWFHIRTAREEREDNAAREWLEWATGVQKRAMYDRESMLVRATKEGDNDFACFGQAVLSIEVQRGDNGPSLLYRCWHLRDVAWCENYAGKIDTVHRKWKPTAQDLVDLFGDDVHPKVRECVEKKGGKDRYKEIHCRHIVLPAKQYEGKWRTPYVSLHIDVDNQHVMRAEGSWSRIYIIPRWQTVSGSAYAHSPATVTALPDARLLQAITLTLLEAGEKAAEPPMVATQNVVRSDVQLFAGGITWVDDEYDEKLGQALRPLTQDTSGLGYGIEINDRVQAMIKEAFFINRLQMPPAQSSPDMTAFEVGQRIQEYIRQALPLFEPMESDYNGALCEETFDILMRNGAFGSMRDIPDSIKGSDVVFRFESPLREMTERKKGQTFLESRGMLAAAAELDPMAGSMLDARKALRDVLNGIGTPAKWMRDDQQMAAIDQAAQQAQTAQNMLDVTERGAQVAEQFGKAGQALKGMGEGG